MTDETTATSGNAAITGDMLRHGELAREYAALLGLSDQRVVIDFSPDHDKNGTVSYHSHYPNVAMTLRDAPPPDDAWPFDDLEETIAHELVHVVMRDLDNLIEKRVLPQLPKAARRMARDLFRHETERAVEVIGRGLVAAKHGHKTTGKVLVRPEPKKVKP